MENLIELLTSMVDILEREKEALIVDDVDILTDIVQEKNQFVEELSSYKGQDYGQDQEVLRIIGEIDKKQEINLMLIEQAKNYNDVFLSSLKKATEDKAVGYSRDGKFSKIRGKSIIDQTV